MTGPAPRSLTAGQSAKRALAFLAGVFLLLFGLTMISMCGSNRHIFGALAGALGGILIGASRRARRVTWHALIGGVAGAAFVVVLMNALHDACDDLLIALPSGLLTGLGAGLLGDATRRSPPPAERPSPPGSGQTGA